MCLAGNAMVTQLPHFACRNFLQPFMRLMDTQFLYQIPPKLPGNGVFWAPADGRRRYNVLLGNNLDLPQFGIRPVIHKYRR